MQPLRAAGLNTPNLLNIFKRGKTALRDAVCRIACLAPTLCNATRYYGEVHYGFLPIVQKVSLILWVSWLFWLFFSDSLTTSVGQA